MIFKLTVQYGTNEGVAAQGENHPVSNAGGNTTTSGTPPGSTANNEITPPEHLGMDSSPNQIVGGANNPGTTSLKEPTLLAETPSDDLLERA